MHHKEPVIIAHVQSDILSMCYAFIHVLTLIKQNVAVEKILQKKAEICIKQI